MLFNIGSSISSKRKLYIELKTIQEDNNKNWAAFRGVVLKVC